MSPDESDVDCNSKQVTYTVVKPNWWHPNLHNWLKVFDQLHHRNHINSWSLDKCGAFPHICIGSQKVHKRVQVLSGLPINAYDPKWLEGQEALYVKHMLCPNMVKYMFAHSSDMFAHSSDMIAYISNSPVTQYLISITFTYRLLCLEPWMHKPGCRGWMQQVWHSV